MSPRFASQMTISPAVRIAHHAGQGQAAVRAVFLEEGGLRFDGGDQRRDDVDEPDAEFFERRGGDGGLVRVILTGAIDNVRGEPVEAGIESHESRRPFGPDGGM